MVLIIIFVFLKRWRPYSSPSQLLRKRFANPLTKLFANPVETIYASTELVTSATTHRKYLNISYDIPIIWDLPRIIKSKGAKTRVS